MAKRRAPATGNLPTMKPKEEGELRDPAAENAFGFGLYNEAVDLQVAVRDLTGRTPSLSQVLRGMKAYLQAEPTFGSIRISLAGFLREFIDGDNADQAERKRLVQEEISRKAGAR